jgi:urease accessory protein
MTHLRIRTANLKTILLGLAAVVSSSLPVLAHHPMGGAKVTTFGQGLLSGLGHPVLGADHLAFLLALGIAAAFVATGARVIAAFMVASFAGVVLHLAHVGLPYVEPGLAVTVMAAGLILIAGGLRTNLPVLVLALIGGVLHGYALAESIVGVEPTPLAAYLIGLTVIQSALMTAAMLAGRVIFGSPEHGTQRLRWAGGVLCLVGAYFLVTAVVSA